MHHQDAVTTSHPSTKADLATERDLTWNKDARVTSPETRVESDTTTQGRFNQRSSAMHTKSFTPSPLILGNSSDENIAANVDPAKLSDPRNRWRFTGPTQIVDAAGSHWDIAEEIMKMQIHDGRKSSPGANAVDPAVATNQGAIAVRDSNSSSPPLNTPSSDASSSSPDNDSNRLVLHSRAPSSDTSSEPSVVTPLHLKVGSGSTGVVLPTSSEETMLGKNERALISDTDVRQMLNGGNKAFQYQQNADAQAASVPNDDQYANAQQPRYPSLAQSQLANYGPPPPLPPQHMQRGPHMPSMPLGYDYRFPLGPRQPPPHAQQQQPQQPQLSVEELQVDYNLQPRLFGVPNGTGTGGAPQNPHGNNTSPINDLRASTGAAPFTPNLYRQQQGPPHRAPTYPPPPHMAMPTAAAMPSQPPMAVPAPFYPPTQPMYDLVMPGRQMGPQAPPPPGSTSFRPQHHHHSSSDSASLREMALMHAVQQQAAAQQQQQQQPPVAVQQAAQQAGQRNTPPMMSYSPSPGMYTPPSAQIMYGNQYYAPSLVADVAQALARLPPGYANALNMPGYGAGLVDPQGINGGPSANNRKLGLYKTELCRSWEEKGSCRYGPKCQFAHGEDEIRKVQRHPKYKTEICRTFWVSGSCPYGKRCCFIHTELPSNGAPGPNGAGEEARPGANPASNGDGRARSLSTGSDPSEGNASSLLARISARRTENPVTAVAAADNASGSPTPPGNPSAPPAAPFGRPAIGSLKLDTASLETSKNGYPYSSNPAMPAPGISIMTEVAPQNRASQVPVTAGPDFGRHAAARLQVVGYNTNSGHQGNGTSSNGHQYGHGHFRHSLSGNEALLSSASSAQQPSSGQSFSSASRSEQTPPPAQQPQSAATHSMGHTHARSDSGNSHHWAEAIPRGHLTAHPSHAASEMNAPWLTARPEIAVNERRYNERNWV